MSQFRPCIDIHEGKVKQIVGGTLRDEGPGPRENFVSTKTSAWYAETFRDAGVSGGHVIKLGPGNDEAAREALAAWPGGLQVGGGIHGDNARQWLDAGASHVILTSWLFDHAHSFQPSRAEALAAGLGKERIVIDLSCRKVGDGWRVAMNRWQTLTDLEVHEGTLNRLSGWCDEFLVHAADVEGLQAGMDEDLITRLSDWSPIPVTYAGGARSLDDLDRVERLSQGRVDLTIGSALDLFGGHGVTFDACVEWNRTHRRPPSK